MSEIWVNTFKNENGNGAPNFPNGVTVTGIITASTLNQNVTGDVNIGSNIKQGAASGVVTATTFVGNLTGAATQLATNATGANLTLSGNLGVGGTITYEDVARVDATGISTFREGFKVGPLTGIGLTAYADGSVRSTGIGTFAHLYGQLGTAAQPNITSLGTIASLVASSAKVSDLTNNRVVIVGASGELEDSNVFTYNGTTMAVPGVNVSGIVTASSYQGRHSQIPKVAKTSGYTLVATDAGQMISTNSGVTIPNSVLAAGDCVSVFNDSSSNITLTQGSGMQVRKGGDTSTGNLTLKPFGVATIWWNTGGTCVVTGNLA